MVAQVPVGHRVEEPHARGDARPGRRVHGRRVQVGGQAPVVRSTEPNRRRRRDRGRSRRSLYVASARRPVSGGSGGSTLPAAPSAARDTRRVAPSAVSAATSAAIVLCGLRLTSASPSSPSPWSRTRVAPPEASHATARTVHDTTVASVRALRRAPRFPSTRLAAFIASNVTTHPQGPRNRAVRRPGHLCWRRAGCRRPSTAGSATLCSTDRWPTRLNDWKMRDQRCARMAPRRARCGSRSGRPVSRRPSAHRGEHGIMRHHAGPTGGRHR
jgi:hypothetical protein